MELTREEKLAVRILEAIKDAWIQKYPAAWTYLVHNLDQAEVMDAVLKILYEELGG